MSFLEERLERDFDLRHSGGVDFAVEIVQMRSGHESRNLRQAQDLAMWNIGDRIIDESAKDYLLGFWRKVNGTHGGFRGKDWTDYHVTDETLTVTGEPTIQLAITEGSYVKNIRKPVSGTLSFKRGAGSYTPSSVDYTTGIVTLALDSSATITNITQANPGVVTTSAAHGFSNGESVYITGVAGMTEVNDTAFVIAGVTSTTFQIVDTTTYTAYSSGGTASQYVQPSETLSWTGEFDKAVRFNGRLNFQFLAYEDDTAEHAYQLFSLPVVEIRDEDG